MKTARKVFAILFLIVFLLYGGDAFFRGIGSVADAAASVFPSGAATSYVVGNTGSRTLPLRIDFLDGHARLQTMLGKTESGGLDVIAANDDTFITTDVGNWNRAGIEQFAITLYRLNQNLENIGMDTEVMFINAPTQIINDYTVPLEDFPLPDEAQLTETMLYYLRSYNVESMDTRQTLENTTLQSSEYIYKTDSKWTTQASFMAARALLGRLNDQYGEEIEIYEIEDFEFTTYEDIFLGTMGMRAGESFTGREDFTVITPALDTSFTYQTLGNQETSVTGTFEEVLINLNHLEPVDPYAYNAYSVYMDGGADYHRIITNNQARGGPKALFIHDVSALPFAAFTSLGFSETHLYWPGLDPDSYGFNVLAYVIENDIDYVFFLSESNYYALESLFQVSIGSN